VSARQNRNRSTIFEPSTPSTVYVNMPWVASSGVKSAVPTVVNVVAAWVLASDDAFQDAAADVAAKRESRRAAANGVSFKARTTGLHLDPTGRPELAFAWKAAQQTFRLVDRRSIARLAAIVVSLSVAAASIGRGNGLAAILGAFALVGVGFSVLMGPQALRIDLRQDLRHLELLKTLPVKASATRSWPGP